MSGGGASSWRRLAVRKKKIAKRPRLEIIEPRVPICAKRDDRAARS
jgi:hypothetical protein